MEQQLQSFPVIYDKTTYNVDLDSLINSSQRFKELIDPFIEDQLQMKELRLEILCKQFTKRDVVNFLKICQKLPTDVQNSEMEEICEIAKMFKAEAIYQKGLSFIQSNLNPKFNVPDNKYDGSDGKTYLVVNGKTEKIYHDPNICDAIFDDDTIICNNKTPKKETFIDKDQFVIYQVIFENHRFKRDIYKFVNDDQVIYSAKLKYNEIFIAKGEDVHIREKENQIAHILRKETTISNLITTNDQTFEVRYIYTRGCADFPIDLSFKFKDKILNWTQKKPKINPETGKCSLNYNGKFNHTPIHSSKNTILQDKSGHTKLIIRQMSPTTFEIETLSVFDPLIVFSIGLSGILGPFFDPWTQAQYK